MKSFLPMLLVSGVLGSAFGLAPGLPAAAQSAGLRFVPDATLSISEAEAIREAGARAVEVLSGDCLRRSLLGTSLIETQGRTTPQVVSHLQSLKYQVRIVMFDEPGSGRLAWTIHGIPEIHANRYYYQRFSRCERVANLLHEASHVAGYTHDDLRNIYRTVPYALEVAVGKCC